MKKKTNKVIFLFIQALLISSCSIIFEEDISDEVLYVIMPVDGTESVEQEQLFWWETFDGVIKYNLQIVEGNFLEPHSLVADTNISGDKFRIDLSPGNYEWRIRGWNNYSETDYFYSLLTIADTATIDEK